MPAKLSGPMLPPRSGGAPKYIVVLLHGYGSDGADLIGLAPHWQDILPDALFVAPNAPEPCPGNPFGFQWFDPYITEGRVAGRQQGLPLARPVLVQFLDDLWAQTGLGARDTILAGFSQGAMMALHVGVALPDPLAGIIAFSGAFTPPDGFPAQFAKPAICIVHGDMDEVVELSNSEQANAALVTAGYAVDFHVSEGVAHGIAPDGLAFAGEFLGKITAVK